MNDLKSALKESKQLLSAQKSQEALDVLQPFLDREVEDYLLFSFAALANANLEYYEDAQELYENGIQNDSTKPPAWMGLFKLYDAEDINLDKRGLEVADKILEIGDAEKKLAAWSLKRRIWLKFGMYEQLTADIGTDLELIGEIVDKISSKKQPTAAEKDLLEKAFEMMAQNFTEKRDYQLKYCHFLFDAGKPYREQVMEYCRNTSEKTEWLLDRLLEFLAEDYFVTLNLADNDIWNQLDQTLIDELIRPAFSILQELRNGQLTKALELLDQLTYGQTVAYPTCLVTSRLLVEIENWEQLVKVLNAVPKRPFFPSEVLAAKNWLLVKGYLEADGAVPDNLLIDSCCSAETIPSEFLRERLLLETGRVKKTEEWKNTLNEEDCQRVKFLELFYAQKYTEAIAEGASLQAGWKDLLNLAEAHYAAGQDSVPLLVKAAKLAPRSSRVFYMLGRALRTKNPVKARACLERAVKVRSSNLTYVRELDDLLATEGADAAARLNYLKPLKTMPRWARERLAKLCLSTGDLETATSELQRLLRETPKDTSLWAKLAEAYSRKGHLNSAVNAYEQILELQPKTDHYISLVGLLIRLRKNEEALEKCAAWREIGSESAEAATYMDILEILANLRLALVTFGEGKMSHVRKAVQLLKPVLAKDPNFSLPYKLAGDVLLQISRHHQKYFDSFELDPSWQITTTNILEKAADFYAKALQLCRLNILAWSDLATALLLSAQQTDDTTLAQQAVEILKKAIQQTDFDATKSVMWSLMGEARRLMRQSPASQQHCYVRALQLNKANDEAWLRLAVLYMENGMKNEAHQAFETALKYNPQSAEAWCGWAAKAQAEGVREEAEAMFRQSLIIKALPMAVTKFTRIVCEDMDRTRVYFDTSSVLCDFPEIFDIYYSNHSRSVSNSSLLTHLGVLAELFGHYSEAIQCHKDAGTAETDINMQRVLLKEGVSLQNAAKLNSKWIEMAKESSPEKLLDAVKRNDIYGKLFELLKNDDEDGNELRELFRKHRKQISMPLVVSSIILFKIPISDSTVQILHDVLPRHELVDVFPTILPDGMDTELKYLEQDGEAPFRYRHHIARRLYDELTKRREAQTV